MYCFCITLSTYVIQETFFEYYLFDIVFLQNMNLLKMNYNNFIYLKAELIKNLILESKTIIKC